MSKFIFIKLFYEFCHYLAMAALEMQFSTLLCTLLMAFKPCIRNLYFFSFGLDFGVCFIHAIFCFYLFCINELNYCCIIIIKGFFCIYNPVLLYQYDNDDIPSHNNKYTSTVNISVLFIHFDE